MSSQENGSIAQNQAAKTIIDQLTVIPQGDNHVLIIYAAIKGLSSSKLEAQMLATLIAEKQFCDQIIHSIIPLEGGIINAAVITKGRSFNKIITNPAFGVQAIVISPLHSQYDFVKAAAHLTGKLIEYDSTLADASLEAKFVEGMKKSNGVSPIYFFPTIAVAQQKMETIFIPAYKHYQADHPRKTIIKPQR